VFLLADDSGAPRQSVALSRAEPRFAHYPPEMHHNRWSFNAELPTSHRSFGGRDGAIAGERFSKP
jgi:hypothetical protein